MQELARKFEMRGSLRVPASGLPGDMVHMLEELDSQSNWISPSELLRPPPSIGDEIDESSRRAVLSIPGPGRASP
jgi:hypothetical protein